MDEAVGSKLREARERRRLSLQEIEAATKIRARLLQALENEEWDQLPGDTYARAFIRTYGNFLGLDGHRLAEAQRRQLGSTRPGERLPREDPRPWQGPRARRRLPARLVATLVFALAVAALLAVGLTGDESGDQGPGSNGAEAVQPAEAVDGSRPGEASPSSRGHELGLVADAEVWVCLLDGKDRPLVNGRILGPGEAEGPFRSGSFTLSLGNGEVSVNVDGKQLDIPQTSSPIGFAIDSGRSLRELPEAERPTCT